MTRQAEEEIVRKLRAGEATEENFRHLFESYYPRVRRFFRQRGFTPDETLDLVQETFLRVYSRIDSLQGQSSFEAWLFSVAMNVGRMVLRERMAEKRAANEVPLETLGGAKTGLTSSDSDAFALSLASEKAERVRRAILSLPPQQRSVLVLRLYQDLKYHEIATVMGVSIDTVKSHLSQARSRLKSALAEDLGANES